MLDCGRQVMNCLGIQDGLIMEGKRPSRLTSLGCHLVRQ
uniref:Uncharacterized protein n=1 Tax=Anguilla anguilla TaxID=7936 RepID=A0A0E9S3Z9_ANGAN